MRRSRAAAVLAAVALLLGACTGVPTSSRPMIVKTIPVGGGASQPAATTPASGIDPRDLIADFLDANVADASAQTSPRAFLTSAARDNWSDATVTVLAQQPTVRDYDAATGSVVVTGQIVGTVDASGIYTPALQPAKSPAQNFGYTVTMVNGQYRISGLRNGLLLSESEFLTYYTQRSVYYFDLAHQYLVPDSRWTSLTDPTQLADFLLDDLALNPSPGIQDIVSTDTLPQQATARRISVDIGSRTRVDVPGAAALGPDARNQLAEVIAATLADVVRSNRIVIVDGGKRVPIPEVHGTSFRAAQFTDDIAPRTPGAYVYFLRRGQLFGQDDARLGGAVNNGDYFLQSVAMSEDKQQGTLAVAATADVTPTDAKLLVGTQSGGLRATSVHGQLTRPAYAPGRSEVWVGDGQEIYRVTVDNTTRTQQVSAVPLPSGAPVGRVVALRLSPDGSRIAIVLHLATGQQQLYVAAVVRGPGQVRIDTLSQVSPPGVTITDVAWAEPLKLLAIGNGANGYDHRLYYVGVDGSAFTPQGTGNLPGPPTTLTVAVHQHPWVTADKSVWEQDASSSWDSPGSGSSTLGYAPTYLE